MTASSFSDAFPNSRKVTIEGGRGIRVPVREIVLSGGEPPLRVYDTSGPQGTDVRRGSQHPAFLDTGTRRRRLPAAPLPALTAGQRPIPAFERRSTGRGRHPAALRAAG
jgi:hypothetical protein